jgi:hypothetical protein
VDKLRQNCKDLLSLVARAENEVVGHKLLVIFCSVRPLLRVKTGPSRAWPWHQWRCCRNIRDKGSGQS